jgi:hypothetical protein
MTPDDYASDVTTEAFDALHRAARDLELLMGVANVMRSRRDHMALGDSFFVEVERDTGMSFKPRYFRPCTEKDTARYREFALVEINPDDAIS